MIGQISSICLHANEGCESKTKDSVYNAHLFQWEKSAHYTRVNKVILEVLSSCVTKFLV